MTDELVERVARALVDSYCDASSSPCDAKVYPCDLAAARAAIEATQIDKLREALGATAANIIAEAEGVIERATVHTDAVAFAAGQIDAAEATLAALQGVKP